MKKLLFLYLILLYCPVLLAAPDNAKLSVKARERMVDAFGGQRAIDKIKYLQYSILRTDYTKDSVVTTRTDYKLDLRQRYVTATTTEGKETVIKKIGADGAWLIRNGQKEQLSQEDKEKLEGIFFYNFLTMLQNKKLTFEHVMESSYKGREADVIRVSHPENPTYTLDLFIAKDNGEVLTSTKPGPGNSLNYPYYADELEYKPVNRKINFPMVYQIYTDGNMVTEGRFVNMKLKE